MFSRIDMINDHLCISSAGGSEESKVRHAGVTTVINCTLEVPNIDHEDITSYRIAVDDYPSADLSVYFDKCADWIEETEKNGGVTLVHCMAGASRSATICIAYLMKKKGMTLRNAYKLVKLKRKLIRPNVGFFRQLIEYEKSLFGENSVELVESPIGFIPDVYAAEAEHMVVWNPSKAKSEPTSS